jgi:DNA-binding LacI/PurR family transcriptional regulator
LESAFATAGYYDSVVSVTEKSFALPWGIPGPSADQQPALVAFIAELQQARTALKDSYDRFSTKAPRYMDRLVAAATNSIDTIRTFSNEQEFLSTLFERAFRHVECTAWVASDDHTAITACDYLADRSRRVPLDISVIGFDNSAEAQQGSLTSYSFNLHRVAHAMLSFVVNPRCFPASQRRTPIEIDGTIVARRSTGKKLSAT